MVPEGETMDRVKVEYVTDWRVPYRVYLPGSFGWVATLAGCRIAFYAGSTETGLPPSAQLRTLIEAGAPWYVVLDKLAEEYPQWQPHFDKATRVVQAG